MQEQFHKRKQWRLLKNLTKGSTELNLKNYKAVDRKKKNESLFYCEGAIPSDGRISKPLCVVQINDVLSSGIQ